MADVIKTIKPSGGDYTSLSGWEAGEQQDLVSAGDNAFAECYAMSDTTLCDIFGWTTGASNYIKVYTPTAERHDGKYDTSAHRMELTDSNLLIIGEDFVRVDGSQFQSTKDSTGVHAGININFQVLGSGAEIQISNCIFEGVLTGSSDVANWYGIYDQGQANAWTLKVRNNIIYDFQDRGGYNLVYGFDMQANCTAYLYNNTLHFCRRGYGVTGGTCVAKNNIAQDCDTNDGFYGTFDGASTNNCSDDSGDAPGSNPQTGEVTFVNEGADDFHLDSSDTVALDNGVDLSSDTDLPFSDDIDGETRSGTWDIGADELIAAGADIGYLARTIKQTSNHLLVR